MDGVSATGIWVSNLFSKEGKQNKRPDNYENPPTPQNTDCSKSNGELADEAAARIEDTKRPYYSL